MKKFTIVTAAAAILVSGVIGANVLADDKDDKTLEQVRPAVQTITKQTEPVVHHVTEKAITLEQAKDIALKQVDHGVIDEVEVERKRGEVVYEVEVDTNDYEYEFKINEAGKILKEEKEKRDDDRKGEWKKEKKTPSASSIISPDEAKRIALNEVSGEIDDIELEREDGRYIYEVEIEREHENDDDDVEVYIDAVTGKVLYVEWD